MPIYEYNGVHYDIDTTDPTIAKQKILASQQPPKSATDYAKDFGKSAASLADVVAGTPSAIAGMVGYAGARALQQSPEEASQLQQRIMSGQVPYIPSANPIGNQLGITNDPAYQNEITRQALNAVGQGMQSVAQPISKYTGAPQQDVENMLGTASMLAGPALGRAGSAVARGAYAAEPYIKGAITTPTKGVFYDFPKGVIEGLVNKEYNPQTSAMVPLRETYTPNAPAQRFMGNIPGVAPQTLEQLQSQARPTSEIVNGPVAKFAQAISPKTLEGETLVPLKGQAMQAFGERVGRGVRTNPGQALLEGIGTAVTGIPFKTLAQGAGELGARYLGAKTGFSPGFSQRLGQAQGRAGLQSQIPQTPLLTNNPTPTGPVAPPTMYVAPEGIAGTNINQVSQAGATQKYAPQPVAQPTALPPAQASQIAAANRIINAPPVATPTVTTPQPKVNDVLAQIRARANNTTLPSERWTPGERQTLQQQLQTLQQNSPEPMTPAQEINMKKQVAPAATNINNDIITDFATNGNSSKIDMVTQTTPIDISKTAYNDSNATKGMANYLVKNGVDSIPRLEGMTESQVIHSIFKQMTGKRTKK